MSAGSAGAWECAVCLDLMCKPVVPPCGHAFCFSCGHRAMNPWGAESRCPLCRGKFRRFPRVCRALHGMLQCGFPEAYAARLEEVEEETTRDFGTASPQVSLDGTEVLGRASREGDARPPATRPGGEAEGGSEPCRGGEGVGRDLSRFFGCSRCQRLLLEPVVLNCGHAMCRTCFEQDCQQTPVAPLPPEARACRCRICGEVQLGDLQVCQTIQRFLQDEFPREYEQRRLECSASEAHGGSSEGCTAGEGVSPGQTEPWERLGPPDTPSVVADPAGPASTPVAASAAVAGDEEEHPPDEFVHFGVGCDSCGAFPIVGRRYRCTDCPEAVGYDLCALCMAMGTTGAEGRFDQNHKPHHSMVEVAPAPTIVHKLARRNGESIESIIRQIEMVTEMREEDPGTEEEEGAGVGEEAGGGGAPPAG